MSQPPAGLDVRAVLDAYPSYVLLIDEDHTILEVNAAVTATFGRSREAFVGQYCPRAVHGLDEPFPGCPLEEARELAGAVERELFDATTGRWVKSGVYPTGQVTSEGKRIFLHVVTDITDARAHEAELLQTVERESALNDLLRVSATVGPRAAILGEMLQRLLSVPWLAIERKGAVFLADPASGDLVLEAHLGLGAPLLEACARVRQGFCLCGRAAATRQIVFADCVDERHDVVYDGMHPHGHVSLPILRGDRLLGVLTLYVAEGTTRASSDESFLNAAAEIFGAVIAQHEAVEALEATVVRLRSLMGGTIEVLANAVESRDAYTAGHQRRVSDLARAVATEMGLSQDAIEGVRVAGMIHDLGKLAIPAEILSSSRVLRGVELALVRSHAEIGYEIIRPVEFPWPLGDAVHQHHERLDGTGYPLGLVGDAICLGARVLAVCDVVEAMASHRPWRAALGIPAALAEIREKRGLAFDADVVDACVRLFEERGYQLRA